MKKRKAKRVSLFFAPATAMVKTDQMISQEGSQIEGGILVIIIWEGNWPRM